MSTPPTRGPSRLHALRAALQAEMRVAGAEGGDELVWLFRRILGMIDDPADPRAKSALMIIGDCLPKYKAATPAVELALDPDPVTAHAQIIKAVGAGVVPPDTAAALVALLEAGQRIAGAGELAERVEMLEDLSARLSRLAESQAEEIKMLSLALQNGKSNPSPTGGN